MQECALWEQAMQECRLESRKLSHTRMRHAAALAERGQTSSIPIIKVARSQQLEYRDKPLCAVLCSAGSAGDRSIHDEKLSPKTRVCPWSGERENFSQRTGRIHSLSVELFAHEGLNSAVGGMLDGALKDCDGTLRKKNKRSQ
jgi:hypothetical protein